ncbi:helix-turn-helix domain-containing protein [Sphingobacterium rhinopitheci]|uniref:helix-turn-helix domain-containing protein n=1 Tax=Sphingobacterium rhinopitheci TaxID=2781960 RepID=UPI001F5213E1|nr:helix-turn-helix domain-containing protein [Sphingobacterium rhinopitheci]MCI0922757.1 helix-turn-helix domain-containing protein [Sphingobacterium rhinopitheci]
MEQVSITNINKQEFVDIIEKTVKRVLGSIKPQVIDSRERPIGVSKAAQILLLSIPSIYRKSKNLEIPHFKKGNRLYFYESELEAWLKDGQKLTQDQLGVLSDIYLKR